jgi:type II secretory pathway predicted ATPase ExeA
MITSTVIKLPPANAYLIKLGLNSNPFPISPDAGRYFLTENLEELIHEVLFCIQQRKGFMVVSGEVGLGKTTFSRFLIEQLKLMETSVAVVFNSFLQEGDLLDQICADFGLTVNVHSLRERIDLLNGFLMSERRLDRNCVIIIDDAQNMSIKTLETIRLLSNLETNSEKLVQVLLLGQQELLTLLRSDSLRQLRSRIALSRVILPLTEKDLARYVGFKLTISANTLPINISARGVRRLFVYSRGNLRRANLILDRAMMLLLQSPARIINAEHIKVAMLDLDVQAVRKKYRKILSLSLVVIGIFTILTFFFRGQERPFERMLNVINHEHALSTEAFFAHLLSSNINKVSGLEPISQDDAILTTNTVNVVANDIAAPSLDMRKGVQKGAVQRSNMPENPTPIAVALTQPLQQSRLLADDQLKKTESYLEEFELSPYSKTFYEYISRGDIQSLNEQLLAPLGFSALALISVPEVLKTGFPILELVNIDGKNSEWIVWKPELKIDPIVFAERSANVLTLQQVLASEGYYTDTLDAVAGINTIKALLDFQASNQIPLSAQVDPLTLFVINQTNKNP